MTDLTPAFEPISISDMHPGDNIAIARKYCIGYSANIAVSTGYVFKTVKRTTPKKTRVQFTDDTEFTSKNMFYLVTDEIIEEERRAMKRYKTAKFIAQYLTANNHSTRLAELTQIARYIRKIDDKKLEEMYETFDKCRKICDNIIAES